MFDLNVITKDEFVSMLIINDECEDFYLPREKELLEMNFDFEQMKQDFENWLIENED